MSKNVNKRKMNLEVKTMKLIDLTCSKCGATLQVNPELTKCMCQYCGNEMLIDNEVQHHSLDNGFEFGYQAELGRIHARQDFIKEQKERERQEQIAKQKELEKHKLEQKRLEDEYKIKKNNNKGTKDIYIQSTLYKIISLTLAYGTGLYFESIFIEEEMAYFIICMVLITHILGFIAVLIDFNIHNRWVTLACVPIYCVIGIWKTTNTFSSCIYGIIIGGYLGIILKLRWIIIILVCLVIYAIYKFNNLPERKKYTRTFKCGKCKTESEVIMTYEQNTFNCPKCGNIAKVQSVKEKATIENK